MFLIAQKFPYFVKKRLFGDRKKYGTEADINDKEWGMWLDQINDFYTSTQKQGIGEYINNAGYKILKNIDFTNKIVLEVGPGSLPHLDLMQSYPAEYIIADVDKNFLEISKKKLDNKSIVSRSILIENRADASINEIKDSSVDILLTFYSLEHFYDLEKYLLQYKKYLKNGGFVIGCVPCEGGLFWGLGRFATSRRWMKKNTVIDYDKIICWEHPNFLSTIKKYLDKNFVAKKINFFPFKIKNGDINLVFSFIYQVNK